MARRTTTLLVLSLALMGSALADEPVDAGVEAPPVAAVAAPAPTTPPATDLAQPPVLHPNAGFGNDVFYVRSDDDNFILIPSGRLQQDFYGYQGGVNQPFNTFTPKRARIELFGSFMHHWDFQLGSEFDNTTTPIATDIFVNANYTRYANLQVGQFDAPFTMENRTSDKYTDMQERSRVVGAFAIPENKEIGAMIWGQPEGKWAYWSSGIFNGEGLQNFKHGSNDFDSMSRAWIFPGGLAGISLIKDVWLGASLWDGFRKSSFTNQLDRLAMKTQAGFSFFNTSYGSIHMGDQGNVIKYGGELNAPIGPVVFKAELIHDTEQTRELDETVPTKPVYVRTGNLTGTGVYGRITWAIWGDPLINGLAGTQLPPHLFGQLKAPRLEDALQLVVNVDHISWSYTADDGATTAKDKLVGDYTFDAYGLGVNYWYTKHVRVTGDVIYYDYGGAGPHPLATSNNAYEVTFRLAIAI